MNFDIIAGPLGKFLYFIYNTLAFQNYGLAIIIFTVVVKLILLPLTVKQYRSTSRMQEIQPLIQDIQRRYKNDKEKLNQEMMKVYSENKVNPAGGCLPLLIQMPILLSLYWVIIQPLKFMLGKTAEQVETIVKTAEKLGAAFVGYQRELQALNWFGEHKDALSQVSGALNANELINFQFLGLHLGRTASIKTGDLFGAEAYIYLPLLLLPVIGVITTYISTKMSLPKANAGSSSRQNAMANSMTNSMMYVGPVMTLIFSFQLPAGVVLYWIAGYVFQIFQQLYMNKHVIKKREHAAEVKAITENNSAAENAANENTNSSPNKGNNTKGGNKGGNKKKK